MSGSTGKKYPFALTTLARLLCLASRMLSPPSSLALLACSLVLSFALHLPFAHHSARLSARQDTVKITLRVVRTRSLTHRSLYAALTDRRRLLA